MKTITAYLFALLMSFNLQAETNGPKSDLQAALDQMIVALKAVNQKPGKATVEQFKIKLYVARIKADAMFGGSSTLPAREIAQAGQVMDRAMAQVGQLAAHSTEDVFKALLRLQVMPRLDPYLDQMDRQQAALEKWHIPMLKTMTDAKAIAALRTPFIAKTKEALMGRLPFYKSVFNLAPHQQDQLFNYRERSAMLNKEYVLATQQASSLPEGRKLLLDVREAEATIMRRALDSWDVIQAD